MSKVVPTVPTSIRLTAKEKKMAEKLGEILLEKGKIESVSISNVLRLCLYYVSQQLLEDLRRSRYGR